MSSAYIVSDGENSFVYATLEDALHVFLKAIVEGGAESLRLEWSA